jgi:hypothetical protein
MEILEQTVAQQAADLAFLHELQLARAVDDETPRTGNRPELPLSQDFWVTEKAKVAIGLLIAILGAAIAVGLLSR